VSELDERTDESGAASQEEPVEAPAEAGEAGPATPDSAETPEGTETREGAETDATAAVETEPPIEAGEAGPPPGDWSAPTESDVPPLADVVFAGRPDVASRYPDDYTPSDHDPPAVEQPHESPETWAGDINRDKSDPGRDNNCGECARAVQSTWDGEPAAAAALSDQDAAGEDYSRMVDWAGEKPTDASMTEVGQRLEELGPGSSAIVGCGWEDGRKHWFNAVNDEGTIKAVDGQSGTVEEWPPSAGGLGFDESDMTFSIAIYFDRDGRVVKN